MVKYLLDTNICVHFLRGQFNLHQKFEQVGASACAISEITLAELVYGAECSNRPEKNHQLIEQLASQVSVLPIFSCIPRFGREKARLRREGSMIDDFDLLIGCTSVENQLTMVTENLGEFSRITGIVIENWVNRSPR